MRRLVNVWIVLGGLSKGVVSLLENARVMI